MTDIVIVSPSPLLADGLAAALAGVAGWQVSVRSTPVAADVLVLHARDAARALALHAALPAQQAAVLLGADLRELARRAGREAQALALLSPDATPEQLRAAVMAVLQGLSVRMAGLPHAKENLPPADHEPLTPRELEVFEYMAKGLSNPDIGGVLGISAHTAKYHVGQILAKVGAATRAEAVRVGLQLGVIGL
jgi:DNA-binding NarL/FixJ family response regulator